MCKYIYIYICVYVDSCMYLCLCIHEKKKENRKNHKRPQNSAIPQSKLLRLMCTHIPMNRSSLKLFVVRTYELGRKKGITIKTYRIGCPDQHAMPSKFPDKNSKHYTELIHSPVYFLSLHMQEIFLDLSYRK